MSLSNISQVLCRNFNELFGENPLFVNLPADHFTQKYSDQFPLARITHYSCDFERYQFLRSYEKQNVRIIFSEQYYSNVLHDLVVMSFPKSKAELAFSLAMIAPFLAKDAQLFFVGDNKSGVKSAPKLAQSHGLNFSKIDSARHCLLFQATFNNNAQPFVLDDWFTYYHLTVNNQEIKVATLPGVFSQNALDKGTAVLLPHLPIKMSGKVLDFGCGAGVISAVIGLQHSDVALSLVDINAYALASSKRTLEINGLNGEVFASNSTHALSERYQHIVTNPPFHQGINTHYEATENFLSECKNHLNRHGQLTVVANSFLNYRPIMEKAFGKTEVITQEKGFTVYQCTNL